MKILLPTLFVFISCFSFTRINDIPTINDAQGETDYFIFCNHCAETGIEKWNVNLEQMTCTYYVKIGNEILVENVPTV